MNIVALYQIFLKNPSVQTDTRKIKSGDLFFALKGPSFNGNHFAQEALSLGASYAVVDEMPANIDDRYVLVEDVLTTLQLLAKHHRQQMKIPFIAITGSNGKTTSKELVTTVLSKKYRTYATEGNLNNHIGVPLTLLKIKADAEMAVIEMGANHQHEIESYCQIALPDFGIINNCGKAHIEGFGGIEGVRKGKGELYEHIKKNGGTIFVNSDLDYLNEMSLGIQQKITYGTNLEANYKVDLLSGASMKISVVATSNHIDTIINSNLVGDYNLPNIALAYAVGAHFGVNANDIKDAIEQYNPDNSRSQLISNVSNKIILDAYNANPTSMRAAILNFAKLDGSKILWLGAMKEMGEDEAKEHQELVEFLSKWEWQQVILVGEEFKQFKQSYLWFADSASAASYIAQNKPQDSLILIKGSRGSKMEKMFEILS